MTEWAAKRFWDIAAAVEVEGGFTVQLDGRAVKTPAKSALVVPTQAMAAAMADEWQAQDEKINPETMPVTRSANAAIDKVALQEREVADMIAAYGAHDLLCYRADGPTELIAKQASAWDPVLHWAVQNFDAKLNTGYGVMSIAQPDAVLKRLSDAVHLQNPFELTALHDLVALSGSLIIGFAAQRHAFDIAHLWGISRIDEDWQISQWGHDDEADFVAQRKQDSFFAALKFYHLLQN